MRRGPVDGPAAIHYLGCSARNTPPPAPFAGQDWEDVGVLLALQGMNAVISWYESRTAEQAMTTLASALAPTCFVTRDGSWQQVPTRELVPGDVIDVRPGSILPADCILLGSDDDHIVLDTSALTGEALPQPKYHHEKVFANSVVRRGELRAVVVTTGPSAGLGALKPSSASQTAAPRLQAVLYRLCLGLLCVSVVLNGVIFLRLLTQSATQSITPEHDRWLHTLSVVAVLLVASAPIAVQAVCTATLAVGARSLARHDAVLSRLEAIEELAGMDVLCCAKTGVLTKNQVELHSVVVVGSCEEEDMVLYAALASRREGQQDAVDRCITEALLAPGPHALERLNGFQEVSFSPFDPATKCTCATLVSPAVTGPDGTSTRHLFQVAKGAPQVILSMVLHDEQSGYTAEQLEMLEARCARTTQELADRGLRAVAMAIKYAIGGGTAEAAGEPVQWEGWEFVGFLALHDPPRDDSRTTVADAVASGLEVKMVTGDLTAVAKGTCAALGMGTNVLPAHHLRSTASGYGLDRGVARLVMQCHGIAEMSPADRATVAAGLREAGHVVGMTGDGVGDAVALQRASVGIAVSDATDAAKAAADVILTAPGLGVIVRAAHRARKVFQRMRSYVTYRVACSLSLLAFFFLAVTALDPDQFYQPNLSWADAHAPAGSASRSLGPNAHPQSFTLPVIALVILALLNDGAILAVAYDKVTPQQAPVGWRLWPLLGTAAALAFVSTLGALILLVAGMAANVQNSGSWFGRLVGSHGHAFVTFGEVQSMVYLQLSLSHFATIFAARTSWFFFQRRPGRALLAAALVACAGATLLALFWPVPGAGARRGTVLSRQGVRYVDNTAAFMAPLQHSEGAVGTVWAWAILVFLAQDAFKVVAGWAMARMGPPEATRSGSPGAASTAAVSLRMAGYEAAQRQEEREVGSEGSARRQDAILTAAGSVPALSAGGTAGAAELRALRGRVRDLEARLEQTTSLVSMLMRQAQAQTEHE